MGTNTDTSLGGQNILKQIVTQFGKQIFDNSNSTRLEGLLSDYLAHDKGMLKLFRRAIKENIAHELLQCDALEKTEQRIKVQSLKVKFKEENFLEESVAYQVVDCFAYALGWNIVAKKTVKPTPQPATEKKEAVEKKTTEPVREKETTRKTAVKTTEKRTGTTDEKPPIVEPDVKFSANYWETSSNAQGGQLWITSSEIVFKPHIFNFGILSKKSMQIVDVVGYEKHGINGLWIKSRYGSGMDLVLWRRDKVISEIEKRK